VERALHPGQPALRDVERREPEHHQERRQDERRRDHRTADDPETYPAEIDRELGLERAWSQLGVREPFLVFVSGDPTATLHEVALHVARERDRATEAERAEPEEIAC